MTKSSLCDALITIPTARNSRSLNLGQAVLLLGYEWLKSRRRHARQPHPRHHRACPPAAQELIDLFEHLEQELDAGRVLLSRRQDAKPWCATSAP